jgi:hypothetical protein
MVEGEAVMPVPEGNITTSDILVPVVEEVVEEVKEEEDDLPELS